MLILFKPWRTLSDLCQPDESWSIVFENYRSSPCCPNKFKELMDNMQLLHECKDNHDNHFADHRSRHHQFRVVTEFTSDGSKIDDFLEDVDEDKILQHLESIDSCYSERKSMTNINTLNCVTHAEEAGVFNVKSFYPQYKDVIKNSMDTQLLDVSSDLKSIWKSEYDHHRDWWKQKASILNCASIPSALNGTVTMSDGKKFRTAMNLQCLTYSNPSIELQSDSGDIAPSINIEHIIHKWTLNPEQLQAF
jgi:hypothetical protein